MSLPAEFHYTFFFLRESGDWPPEIKPQVPLHRESNPKTHPSASMPYHWETFWFGVWYFIDDFEFVVFPLSKSVKENKRLCAKATGSMQCNVVNLIENIVKPKTIKSET